MSHLFMVHCVNTVLLLLFLLLLFYKFASSFCRWIEMDEGIDILVHRLT